MWLEYLDSSVFRVKKINGLRPIRNFEPTIKFMKIIKLFESAKMNLLSYCLVLPLLYSSSAFSMVTFCADNTAKSLKELAELRALDIYLKNEVDAILDPEQLGNQKAVEKLDALVFGVVSKFHIPSNKINRTLLSASQLGLSRSVGALIKLGANPNYYEVNS
jgi:hypothetical protein